MTLANIEAPPLRPARANRTARRGLSLDLLLLALSIGVGGVFLLQGGLEMLCGGLIGAALAARNGASQAISGAFAGLFTGALFAGFFHHALAGLAQLIF